MMYAFYNYKTIDTFEHQTNLDRWDQSRLANDSFIISDDGKIGSNSGKFTTEDALAFYFDGTDDYVERNSNILTGSAGSFSFWLNIDTISADMRLFDQGDLSNDRSIDIIIDDGTQSDKEIIFGFCTSTNNAFDVQYRLESGELQTGQWYHVVITRDGESVSGYINGVSKTMTVITGAAQSGNFREPTTDRFFIGNSQQNNHSFDGLIDEVRIYDTALSADNVESLYNNTFTDTTNLIAHYNGNHVSETTAYDISINSNNGTLTNGATTASGKSNSYLKGQIIRYLPKAEDFDTNYTYLFASYKSDSSITHNGDEGIGLSDGTNIDWFHPDTSYSDTWEFCKKELSSPDSDNGADLTAVTKIYYDLHTSGSTMYLDFACVAERLIAFNTSNRRVGRAAKINYPQNNSEIKSQNNGGAVVHLGHGLKVVDLEILLKDTSHWTDYCTLKQAKDHGVPLLLETDFWILPVLINSVDFTSRTRSSTKNDEGNYHIVNVRCTEYLGD